MVGEIRQDKNRKKNADKTPSEVGISPEITKLKYLIIPHNKNQQKMKRPQTPIAQYT
jgi:hypothetical protein